MFQFHQILDECVAHFGIKGRELAEVSGRSEGNISKIRKGKVGVGIDEFAKIIEACEQLAPGFTEEFTRKLSNYNVDIESLTLREIEEQVNSGRLSNEQVAKIATDLAEIMIAISKRLKTTTV